MFWLVGALNPVKNIVFSKPTFLKILTILKLENREMITMIRILSFSFAIMMIISCNQAFAKSFHYGSTLCGKTEYYCYTTGRHDSWQSLFPKERERNIVMRINRVNIELKRGVVIAIPYNLDRVDLMQLSPFPLQTPALGNKQIIVSLDQLAWGAYDEKGTLQAWGPASGGQNWCQDIKRSCRTDLGKYTVYRKGSSRCASSKYPIPHGGAPIPYCMFFNKGQAIHGSNILPGYNASHGCVRVLTVDAQWLSQQFVKDDKNVKVIVTRDKTSTLP